jgi:putative ABC transport system permease protein
MKKKSPPKWADRFLEWYCSPQLLEDLQGDLHERFKEHLHEKGYTYARWRFLLDVFSFLRPYVIRRATRATSSTSINLFRHYLKIGTRNIYREKKYLIVNSVGLAIGSGCALLLAAYIFSELSYDRSFNNSANVYRISCSTLIDGNHTDFAPIPPAIGPAIKETIPEIKSAARFMFLNGNNVRIDNNGEIYQQPGVFLADSSIFNVLSFDFILGDKSALQGVDRIVVTHSLATKLFGKQYENAKILHSSVKIENHDFFVSAVVKDLPTNTHWRPTALIGWHGYGDDNTWNDSHAYTYIAVEDGTDRLALQQKLNKFTVENENIRKVAEDFGAQVSIFAEPLTSLHLSSAKSYELAATGNLDYVYALGFIAIFFIVSSGINYTNIAIASSLHRAKEIGVRKTMGALRNQIQRQFLTESGVMVALAAGLGLVLFLLLIPYFNSLMSYQLSVDLIFSWDFAIVALSVVVMLSLVSSFYPAFYLSFVKPVDAFKNNISKGMQRPGFRRVLLIVQFSISAVMIISLLAVSRQMEFIQNKSLGFNKENILLIRVPDPFLRDIAVLKENISNVTGVQSVAVCGYYPGLSSMVDEHRVEREGGEMKPATVARLFFDHDYLDLLGLKIVEGRSFDRERSSDYLNAYLVNQAAVKAFGWDKTQEGAIGRRIEGMNYGKDGEVVGVVEDANLFSLKHKIEPLIMNLTDTDGQLYVKLDGRNTAEVLQAIDLVCRRIFDNTPPDFHFLDERLDKMYEADQRMSKVLMTGSYLLVLISCLGLFGLSAFMISQRTKEIGVRKTFGASVSDILMLLSKDYLVLVIIANLVAIPVGYYLMNLWLEGYAYRIELAWWLLIVPPFITAVLALLSVSYQLWKGSQMNPVHSLRYE